MISDSPINNLHDSFIVEQLCDTCAQLVLAASVQMNNLYPINIPKYPILQSQTCVETSRNTPTVTTLFHKQLQSWVDLVSDLMPICLNSGLLKPAHLLVISSLRFLKRSVYCKNNPDVNEFNCSCHIFVHANNDCTVLY